MTGETISSAKADTYRRLKEEAMSELKDALEEHDLPDDLREIDGYIGRFKASPTTTWTRAERVNTAKSKLVWACMEMKAHGLS